MTRINIIPPQELYDQHLVAEYREITMVPASLKRTLSSKQGLIIHKIPKKYKLNQGHVYFFYDKGLYLDKRYKLIVQEMKSRGMNPDKKRIFPSHVFLQSRLFKDWIPTKSEMNIARERINLRVSQKPNWYRKTRYTL